MTWRVSSPTWVYNIWVHITWAIEGAAAERTKGTESRLRVAADRTEGAKEAHVLGAYQRGPIQEAPTVWRSPKGKQSHQSNTRPRGSNNQIYTFSQS